MQPKEFGEYLRFLRKRQGLTIKQLEHLSSISNAYISHLENGKRGIPSPSIIKNLSDHLDVTYEHLMEKAGYVKQNDNQTLQDLTNILEQEIYYKGIKLTSTQRQLIKGILDEFIASFTGK